MPQGTNVYSSLTPTAYGYCSWHKRMSEGVRLIQVTEAGSGPSGAGNLFACGPCRDTYHLVPFADRP
ncbi:hypothetical protein [Streptomyces pseudovenezuelae]|uniref:Uncharacterized protein n=1 Tax=Streptomyces pseudovenezuelae TaxID=67350 RepID=A0ABT6LBW8_9ACTN|nr:hypothetical protein [Streptomyces pseudovenezuelae]MDH6213796.1 hypothetical protein [Streptomyces pseudovenezuelae]